MGSEVILYVVLVLGIVIAGGFLIFFVGDLLMSIFGSKKDEKAIKAKKEKEDAKLQAKIDKLPAEQAEEVKNMPEVASIVYGGAVVEAYNPEEEEANQAETEEKAEEEVADEAEEETKEPNQDEIIAQRRRELMERLARMSEEDDEDEDEDEDEEEEEEPEEVNAEDLDNVSNEELEETRTRLAEVEKENQVLVEKLNEAKASTVRTETVTLGEEELEERLHADEERLKLNEKELRACKKEYMPLKRVSRTLENDERKLRRKEALVAKQKVVLYGVNNYSDIDEEKAKKLAEDLDLLDGLKLSVEHCKEVMEKNADRFPLLEKMYEILSNQNADLKASIERTKAELETLRAKKGN